MIFGSVLVKILLLISHLILIFVLISNYLEKTPMKKQVLFGTLALLASQAFAQQAAVTGLMLV